MKKEDVVKYTVTFVGATPNEAQAINGVLQSISQLKTRDEMPLRKYQKDLEEINKNYVLFKEINAYLSKEIFENNLVSKIEKRIKLYDSQIKDIEIKIKNHKKNIKYINDYINKVKSHIKEEINEENKTVTYIYDMNYIRPFLDLAVIVFEMTFEEPKATDTLVN